MENWYPERGSGILSCMPRNDTGRPVSTALSYLTPWPAPCSPCPRDRLRDGADPRADAAAWAVIDVLPAHPVITTPVATAATGRAKSAVHQAVEQLTECGVLQPLSTSKRNRSWEAVGLLDLLEGLEAGEQPASE